MYHRAGMVVWVKNTKDTRFLEKHGHVLYISKKLKYVVMYVNQTELKQKLQSLSRYPNVLKVEASPFHEVSRDYQGTQSNSVTKAQ